jgi:hypothetical protein
MRKLNLPEDLRKVREEEIIKVFQRALIEAQKRAVDAVFIVGDLWHNAFVKRDTVRATIDFLNSLESLSFFIVPGPADSFALDSPYCSEYLRSIELPRFKSNVHIFESSDLTTLKHPFRSDVTISARSFTQANLTQTAVSEKSLKISGKVQEEEGFKILLLCDPMPSDFDHPTSADASFFDLPERVVSEEDLAGAGFDYVGLGFGDTFADLRDSQGMIFGGQAGALTAQRVLPVAQRLAVFGTLTKQNQARALCALETEDFEMRHIYSVASDISGLRTKDAALEIIQLLKDDGARLEEDIVHIELDGRLALQGSTKRIIDLIKESCLHAVMVDNTRPDYLMETYSKHSPEARFIEAMLVLKRSAEKENSETIASGLKRFEQFSGRQTEKTGGQEKLTGRLVEDALYYGLDALRQKQVNIRNVD